MISRKHKTILETYPSVYRLCARGDRVRQHLVGLVQMGEFVLTETGQRESSSKCIFHGTNGLTNPSTMSHTQQQPQQQQQQQQRAEEFSKYLGTLQKVNIPRADLDNITLNTRFSIKDKLPYKSIIVHGVYEVYMRIIPPSITDLVTMGHYPRLRYVKEAIHKEWRILNLYAPWYWEHLDPKSDLSTHIALLKSLDFLMDSIIQAFTLGLLNLDTIHPAITATVGYKGSPLDCTLGEPNLAILFSMAYKLPKEEPVTTQKTFRVAVESKQIKPQRELVWAGLYTHTLLRSTAHIKGLDNTEWGEDDE